MDTEQLKVDSGGKFRLKKRDPADTLGVTKEEAANGRLRHGKRLAELQELLYAERRNALLIVLQAMDAGGKDGTIKHVMSGVNPQGCFVVSFKQPSANELSHDFLWRIHIAAPAKGMIGIFNRSHYEDVLIARVHNLVPEKEWMRRYDDINNFELILAHSRVHILKFFLHIGPEEQETRFAKRLEDPHKHWKSSPADFTERNYWDQYQGAYEDALTRCSTKEAPWYVIPANHKWFRNYAVAEIVIRRLESLGMKYPEPESGHGA